jgi:membrane-bound lytic murein transglycosylase B
MTRIVLLLLALFAASVWAKSPQEKKPDSYAKRPEVRAFIREAVERHGFVERELVQLFSRVHRADPILRAIQTPAEKALSWQDYRASFVNERRIAGGLAFWTAQRAALERAEREYGVPPEYMVAIIGVETLYGKNKGRWRVIDALSTLAFDYPPRADFFREELVNYLLLARDEGINVFATRGSYAGAFGIPQFMPGSARRYAVDFDGSGSIDLSGSAVDAIGSVANFLLRHGWQPGGEIMFEARVTGEGYRPYASGALEPRHTVAELGSAGVEPLAMPRPAAEDRAALIELASSGSPSEFRLGVQNFYVLTRYNRSALYAAAVTDLARTLRDRRRALEAGAQTRPEAERKPAQEAGK